MLSAWRSDPIELNYPGLEDPFLEVFVLGSDGAGPFLEDLFLDSFSALSEGLSDLTVLRDGGAPWGIQPSIQ